MPSRRAAQAGVNGAPRGETSCSLLNQRRAALTLDFWLASVFALAPTVAGCRRLMFSCMAVQRAGRISMGLSSALAICRKAETHCARFCGDRSVAASIARIASAKEGSMRVGLSIWEGVLGGD